MCLLLEQDTYLRANLKKLCEKTSKNSPLLMKPTADPGRAFSSETEQQEKVLSGPSWHFYTVTSKSSSLAIAPRWSTTHLRQQVPRNCISHAKPRSNWLGHTAPRCYTFIWILTKVILNRKYWQIWFSLVFCFALQSAIYQQLLHATTRAHSKNTNKRSGPQEAPCSPNNNPSSKTVTKLYN